MTRIPTALLALAVIGCAPEAPDLPPTRDAIAIRYVSKPEIQIHAEPRAGAAVLTSYRIGETVTVLSEREDWTEIRLDLERSGWVPSGSLSAEPPQRTAADGSPEPRFRVAPNPVFSPSGARGEIVLEASVNTDGDVVEVRTLRNTTGRPDLEAQNRSELRKAKFYPLLVNGQVRQFIYEHRVTY